MSQDSREKFGVKSQMRGWGGGGGGGKKGWARQKRLLLVVKPADRQIRKRKVH